MKAIKVLQAKYKAGEISEAEYKKQLKALLDDGELTQAQHDEALEYDPDGDEGPKIYTQADMDRSVLVKGRQMVKKALRDAGVDLTDVKNTELLPRLTELVKAGSGKEAPADSELQKKITALEKQLQAKGGDSEEVRRLRIENAIYKAAGSGKLKPHNISQVVRAVMADHVDDLDYDDNDRVMPDSVGRVMKRLAKTEPNLFRDTDGEDNDGDDKGDNDEDRSRFKGKGPGGGTGNQGNDKQTAKRTAMKNEALAMLGIDTTKK